MRGGGGGGKASTHRAVQRCARSRAVRVSARACACCTFRHCGAGRALRAKERSAGRVGAQRSTPAHAQVAQLDLRTHARRLARTLRARARTHAKHARTHARTNTHAQTHPRTHTHPPTHAHPRTHARTRTHAQVGQLGLGPSNMSSSKPAHVPGLADIVQARARARVGRVQYPPPNTILSHIPTTHTRAPFYVTRDTLSYTHATLSQTGVIAPPSPTTPHTQAPLYMIRDTLSCTEAPVCVCCGGGWVGEGGITPV